MISRPTLQDLVNRVTTDVQSGVGLSTPLLPDSVLRVLAKVTAGSMHMLYGFVQFQAAQMFPDTAESVFLDRWASIWGVTREAATFAECVLTVTGVDTSDVPAGTLWVDSNGIEYASIADATIAGATSITVTATTSGSIGTPTAGDTPALVNPVAGVDASATVAVDGIVPGEDTETDAALLSRLLARIQDPPQGGAVSDYVAWARSIAGVTRAWAYGGLYGAGTVGVTFVMDDQVGGPIPSGGVVSEVQAYIDSVRPVTAAVTVFAPSTVTVDFTIHLDVDTADVRAAITAALAAYVSDGGYPGQTLYRSLMYAAIGDNSAGSDFVMSVPAASVVVGLTEVAVMGIVTWV